MRFNPTIENAITSLAYFDSNEEAIWFTVGEMKRLANEGSINPRIRAFAIQAIKQCPVKKFDCEIKALTRAVRQAVRYVPDPLIADTIQDTEYTLTAGGGDCDDLTTLFAALALSLGWSVVFVLGSARSPDTPTHVLPGVIETAGAEPIPIEISSKTLPPGRLPRGFKVMDTVNV